MHLLDIVKFMKRNLQRRIRAGLRCMANVPVVYRVGSLALLRFPGLKVRLLHWAGFLSGPSATQGQLFDPDAIEQTLPERARQIYAELKRYCQYK